MKAADSLRRGERSKDGHLRWRTRSTIQAQGGHAQMVVGEDAAGDLWRAPQFGRDAQAPDGNDR